MKNLISIRTASILISVLLALTILFHVLVILGLIPADIVWGGNIEGHTQFLVMETISIVINLVMCFFACAYAGFIRTNINDKTFRVIFWIMFALFFLNTLGNLAAKKSLETYIFTPITFVLALLCLRLATGRRSVYVARRSTTDN